MATAFTQVVGENRLYQQNIVNDTISSVVWSVSPAGPTLVPQAPTPTFAQCLFFSGLDGSYVLVCTITTLGGQTLKGQARINVVDVVV